jgi:hypothetical protein
MRNTNKIKVMNNKQNRNDKCNCNSGKKYKHCCYSKDQITNALNSLGVNKLYSWGAFYKDDTDEGFSMYMDGDDYLIEQITKCTQQQMNDLKSAGSHIIKHMIKKTFEQLHELIPMWNELVFGTTKRPMGLTANPNLTNSDLASLTFCICQDIHFLSELKAIPDNNFNGMNYVYIKQ